MTSNKVHCLLTSLLESLMFRTCIKFEDLIHLIFFTHQTAKVIDQTDDECVCVTTYEGDEFCAEFVIVTTTVGVLQNGRITFEPPLPPWKTEEICRFQMSTLDMIFLKFDSKFWDDTEYILYASDREGFYPMFLNWEADGLLPAGTNILTTFLAGKEAYRAEHLTDDEVKEEVS